LDRKCQTYLVPCVAGNRNAPPGECVNFFLTLEGGLQQFELVAFAKYLKKHSTPLPFDEDLLQMNAMDYRRVCASFFWTKKQITPLKMILEG